MKSNVGATREKLGFAGGAYIALYVCATHHRVADMKSNVGATRTSPSEIADPNLPPLGNLAFVMF